MADTQIIYETPGVLDVFGPSVEFLSPPAQPDDAFSVIRGTVPPGVAVPLHSHVDVESFYLLSGVLQVLLERQDKLEWTDVRTGGFVHIPEGAKHAWRNTSQVPAVALIVTTARLERFFREIGRPLVQGVPLPPPAPEDLQRFAQIAAKYGHWLATPEENAAAGISLIP